LSPDDIYKLGMLARLEITPSEIDDVVAKLTDIVAMVDQLQATDTTDVVPMAHPLDRSQRLREDLVTEEDHRALYQQNASAVERGLYLVPKVIE
jgi:aspartyl-tRNA(Asn)/glutamyl-tRNA(Gln) amidotransferase subunit C